MTASPATPELEAAIARAARRGAEAWPRLALQAERFASYVHERAAGEDLAAAVDAIHAEDLWLACACADGVPGAVEAFVSTELARLPDYLSRAHANELVDDVRQILLTRLFVSADGRPRILEYSGRGSLGAWLRVASVRAAVDLRRGEAPRAEEPAVELASLADPELDALRVKLRGAFEEALAHAFTTLSDRDHTLMRLHYGSKVTVEALARVYNVHRVSVSRWLTDARSALFEATRDHMRRRMRLSESEFGSVSRLVQSQLDVSLGVLLKTRAPASDGAA